MDDLISSKSYRRYMILLFILAFLPRVILICISHEPLRTPMDELSTLSSAAYIAGLDWQNVLNSCHFYYGAGFSIFLAPLFYFISDPYVLYAAILCVAGALQSLIAPIAFHIMYRYFEVQNKLYLFLAALAASYCAVVKTTCYYNEHILGLLFWLIIWMLCILLREQDNRKKKLKWTILLVLTICYSMTIHTRAQIYLIVLVLTVLLYLFVYKKWLVSPIAAVATTVAGYAAAKLFINWIKVFIYDYHEGDNLRNASVPLDLSKELLADVASWDGWLSTIIGQIHTSFIFTVGLAAIIIPLMLVVLYREFLQAPIFAGRAFVEEKKPLLDMKTPYIIVTALFCILCIGGTIFAQSLSWLPSVNDALYEHPYYSNMYAYKAITYFRYYGSYIGPFMLAGLAVLYHAGELLKRYWGYIITFFASVQLVFCCFVLPHISNNTVASHLYWPFALWNTTKTETHTYVYAIGIIAATVGFAVFFVCFLKKKRIFPVALLLILLVYQHCYSSIYEDGGFMDTYNTRADATYELITMLEDSGEELPHTLYVYDRNKYMGVQKRVYTEQFLLKEYELIPSLPEDNLSEAIVLSDKVGCEELIEMGYSYTAIDDREYIYVLGDKYVNMLENYGYEFSTEKADK